MTDAMLGGVRRYFDPFTLRSHKCNGREIACWNPRPVRNRPGVVDMRRSALPDLSPSEVLRLVQDEGVEFVDYRFCDLPGLMQHVTVPASQLSEDVFTEGHGFDGSSIRGFQEIQESDMILVPDP